MTGMGRTSRRLAQLMLSVFGACIVGYFVYLTVLGHNGWFAMLRAKQEVADAQEKLDRYQKERAELQHKTQLLRAGSLDPDLLEEKSRELLNYSKPNEIVILTPEKNGGGKR
jgi:cell division protein FtsB